MRLRRKTILLLLFSSIMSVGWGQDTTPPELIDITFTPTEIDVSQGEQDLTFSFHISDDIDDSYDYITKYIKAYKLTGPNF